MKIAIPTSSSKTQYYINYAYVQFVTKAGLEPILVTPDNDMNTIIETCDGLLLPGGIDLDPINYEEDNYASLSTDIEKDKFERDLFWSFAVEGKKIAGICRGFQLIVREFLSYADNYNRPGFDRLNFVQHVGGHSLAKDRDVSRTQATHWTTTNNLLYGDEAGISATPVNSMHHQALLCEFPAPGNTTLPAEQAINTVLCNGMFKIMAVADFQVPKKFDGYIVEAVEISNWIVAGSSMKGVQWHPEELVESSEQEVDLIKSFFTTTTAAAVTE